MTAINDRLTELRAQLTKTVARLAELERHAIDAVIEDKGERDISAIETRKAQARDRVVLSAEGDQATRTSATTRRPATNARSDDGSSSHR